MCWRCGDAAQVVLVEHEERAVLADKFKSST